MSEETEYRLHGPAPQLGLVIEPVRSFGAPVNQRLKRLLKAMLRSYGFRVVKINGSLEKAPADETPRRPDKACA